jgi:EAL domain-containing protein (putative c-di-GMP-specific phosphodiesterase class I)/CheY-like chemotaxis protein
MKTLLVDDEPFALKLLARQLDNLGVTEVDCRDSALDALALLETGAAVDLVFCDLQMPEMDGVEFLRHLARIGYAGAVVLVSGEDERILKTAEKLAVARQLNVLGALHKPVSPHQLQHVLEQYSPRGAGAARENRKTYAPEELRDAIAGGQLVNYYQPKIMVANGAIAGMEALVRWQHPRDGLVMPDQFIGTAEEHGLIDGLTRVVLTKALHDTRSWHLAGLNLHVSVNVSMDNLAALDFPEFIAEEARAAEVPLTSLVLEVTESRLMRNLLAQLDILTRLRLKRIGLSIDDFGTGYSSLAQLRDIPFDELKVDRSFVHGACRDASLRAIFDASLGMGHQLGMSIVAEGVEDLDDWNFLRQAGCDMAQGYLIARPMPALELADWMADWNMRLDELRDTQHERPYWIKP